MGIVWCERNSSRYISVEDPTLATEAILADVKPNPSEETAWMAKTAVERLAKMTGKTEEQVRKDLQEKPSDTTPKSFVDKAKEMVGAR